MGCGEAGWLILGGRFSPKEVAFHPPLCPMPSRSLGLPLGQGSRANGQWEKGSSEGAVKPCGGLGEGRQDITLIRSPQPPVTPNTGVLFWFLLTIHSPERDQSW